MMELLTVVAIIAVLASLTIVGFKSAQISASRNRTATFHAAIKSGLEQYFSDNGEYPTPKDSLGMDTFQGRRVVAGPSKMLYQALSGDGDSEILLGTPRLGPSDGRVAGIEVDYVKLVEMPVEMKRPATSGWVLVDGFNNPFQYSKGPDRARPGQPPPPQTTMNATYDLWSFGESQGDLTQTDLGSKQNTNIAAKWIKNW